MLILIYVLQDDNGKDKVVGVQNLRKGKGTRRVWDQTNITPVFIIVSTVPTFSNIFCQYSTSIRFRVDMYQTLNNLLETKT